MAKGISFFFFALMLLVLPLRWILAMIFAAAVHEMGHVIAVKILGGHLCGFSIRCDGALINAKIDSRWKEILAILAGPCAGALLILLCRWMPRVAILAAAQTLFNMLPIYPLDGGRLIRCLGAGKRVITWIEYAAILCLMLGGSYLTVILRIGFLPLVIVFMVIYRVFMEKLLAKRRDFEYNSLYQRK